MAGPLPVHELDIPPPEKLPFAIGSFDRMRTLPPTACYGIAFVTTGPPTLCFVMPGQVHPWRRATGLEGKVILFTGEFLGAYPRDRDVLRALGSTPSLTLSKKDAVAFAAVTREMEEEYRLRGPGCAAILQACLHILLLRASRLRCVRAALPPAQPAK